MKQTTEATMEFLSITFQRLKTNFRTGTTLTINHRRFILQNLRADYLAREQDINEAMKKDLGLNDGYCYLSGTVNVLNEIDLALKKLKKWTSPICKETPLLIFPSTVYELNEPLGTVLVIGAWNYPIATTLLPVISAIAAGNCVIAKPSEQSPYTGKIIAEIMNSLDQKYYMGVEGGVQTSVALNKMAFDLIVFTGGTVTGKFIMKDASDNLCKLVLELGGKNPAIIDQTANLDLAAKRIINAKFMNCGQTCVAPDTVYLHTSIKQIFLDLLIKYTKLIYTNNAKSSSDYSLIVNEFHANRVVKYLEDQNDNIIFQAGVADPKNRFVPPTLLLNPSPTSLIMREEVFGPILPIVEFNDISEVINQVNKLDKPLGVYFFGESSSQNYQDVKNQTSSGSLVLNDLAINYLAFSGGFGGVGGSGMGKIRGFEGFQYCSNQKLIIERPKSSFLDLSARYGPSTEANAKKLRFIGDNFGSVTWQDITWYFRTILPCLIIFFVLLYLFKSGTLVWNFGK